MSKGNPPMREVKFNGIVIGEVPNTGDHDVDARATVELIERLGLRKPRPPFRDIYNLAVGFAAVAADIRKQGLSGRSRHRLAAPFVVNTTFALELYLKALAKKHGADLVGHDLRKLFDSLPSAARAEIEAVSPGVESGYKTLGADFSVESVLTALRGTFVEWRYLYEHSSTSRVDIEPMIAAANILHVACDFEAAGK